ncbi:MAG: DUF1566 domain-containing protein [Candidatus Symbiothrix sp.]|jgi:hypothetical protein|nr:DUF1566 domain-containing protein [Candidatus Symbiothrix sp.]
MKRIKLFMLVATLLVAGNWSLTTVTAQVKIGGDGTPASGAVLDLSSASSGGLLLPRVTLTDAGVSPTEFGGINISTLTPGLMVYNQAGGLLPEGVYVLNASSGSNQWKVASGGVEKPVQSITIPGSRAYQGLGLKTAISPVSFVPANATVQDLVWKSSDASIAKVTSAGEIIAIAQGNAIINAYAADGSGVVSNNLEVSIEGIAVDHITVAAAGPFTLAAGGSQPVTATIYPDDAEPTQVVWVTSNATVSPNPSNSGAAVTISAGNGGVGSVYASAGGINSNTVTLNIKPATPSTLNVDKTSLNVSEVLRLSTTAPAGTVTSYKWTFPSNFTGTTPTTTPYIDLTAALAGTAAAASFGVIATNANGDSPSKTTANSAVTINSACEGLTVPNSRTGFLTGALNPEPTTPTPSGGLCVYKWDGNGGNQTTNGTTKTWDSMTGQSGSWYQTNSFTNPTASIFVGSNAGCESGYRLPSVIELKAIMAYFNTNYGGYNAPNGSTAYATWRPLVASNYYWSSTFRNASASNGNAWIVNATNGSARVNYTYNSYYVRCVKDL